MSKPYFMKFLISILSCSLLVLLLQCKTPDYTPDDYPAAQIHFGSGGGFAGTYTHYYLFENGELFTNSTTDKNYKKIKKIKKNQVSQIFSNYEFLKLDEYNLDEPGNMTYYIRFKNNKNDHKIQWGGNNIQVDKNVEIMYKVLTGLAKS